MRRQNLWSSFTRAPAPMSIGTVRGSLSADKAGAPRNPKREDAMGLSPWSFISKALVSAAALFVLFQAGGAVFAQEENSDGLNFMKNPDITVRDVTIEQGQNEGDKKIAGTFTIYTLEPKYHGDLYYEVSLVRVKDENKSAGDTDNQLIIHSSFPENGPVNLDQGKHKIFNYSLNIPENIWGGLFLVKIKLYTGSGALIASDHSMIDLKGQGKFLEITDKFLASDKAGKSGSGAVFEENDKIYFGISVLNSNTENIKVRADIDVRKENRFGELVKDFNSDQFEIPAGNEVEKKFELRDLETGLYSVSLQLVDENGVSISNVVFDKFMIEGEQALLRILEINPDKLAYADGDTAKIDVRINNPQSNSQNALEVDLTVKLTSAEGNIIGEKTEKVFMAGAERKSSVEIPVEGDLEKYKISVSLSINGEVFSQKEFQSFPSGQSNEAEVLNVEDIVDGEEKTSFWKYAALAGIAILLIIAAGLVFIGFKRFKGGQGVSGGRGLKTFLLLMFSIGGAIAFSMFFDVQSAQADGTLKICVYGKLYDSDKGFYNKLLPQADIYWNGTYVANTGSSCYSLSGPAGTYTGTIVAKKPSYSSGGVTYHFYNSSPKSSFTLRDGQTTRINFYLTAKNGGVQFYTYDCESNNSLGGATVHYGGISASTDSGGYLTVNGIYPGIYRYLYASKSGYCNSDANYVPISSESVYKGSNARFCLKPAKGSIAGRVTVCGFETQGIGNADIFYKGNLLAKDITNSEGYYAYSDIAVGTYDNISFGGVSGFGHSTSRTIEIKPNTTTTANFCLNPNFWSLGYSWLPADGTSYFGFAGKIDYRFFINNSTTASFDNVTVEFLFDGGIIKRVTKDVLKFSNTEFDYDYWNFWIPLGSHSVGAKVYWNGSLVLSEERTININSVVGGWMGGEVTDCESEEKISSARVSCGGDFVNTGADGGYSLRLPIGNYSGAHASKTGYEDSVSRNVTITANETTSINFCMNRQTGSFVSQVLRNGLSVSGASVFWDDPSIGINNLFLGKTNSEGFFSRINILAGTYNGIYASAFSRNSEKKTVIIRANETTRVDFIIPTDPVPTLSATLNANPSSENAPLNGVDLTAGASGTASGTINYTFYCNRSDAGTNITPGYAHKKDGINQNPYTVADVCDYASPGVYTAKVIVEREGLAAEKRTAVTVNAASKILKVCAISCNSGGPALTTITMNENETRNLRACYNTSSKCDDATGDVTGAAVWTEASSVIDLSYINPNEVLSTGEVAADCVENFSVVHTDTVNVTVSVLNTIVCGDEATEGVEECDDGAANGPCPASCSASCTLNDCSGSSNWREVAP